MTYVFESASKAATLVKRMSSLVSWISALFIVVLILAGVLSGSWWIALLAIIFVVPLFVALWVRGQSQIVLRGSTTAKNIDELIRERYNG